MKKFITITTLIASTSSFAMPIQVYMERAEMNKDIHATYNINQELGRAWINSKSSI